jgi:hypothetical protein
MLKWLFSAMFIWALFVGCCLAFNEAPPQTGAYASARSIEPPTQPSLPPVVRQMQALERHARINMICYTGRFDAGELPELKRPLKIMALTVKTLPADR